MKIFLSLGLFFFALSFCNLSERISSLRGGGASNSQNASANSATDSPATRITPRLGFN